jgi:hypothetical protein
MLNDFAFFFNITVAVNGCHHMNDSNVNRRKRLPYRGKNKSACRHCSGKLTIPANVSITGFLEYRRLTKGLTEEVGLVDPLV